MADWGQFEGSVEEVAGLYAAVVEWDNIQYFVSTLLVFSYHCVTSGRLTILINGIL